MPTEVWVFIAVGFAAQLVDGAIGMAYGLSAATMLMATGAPPAAASAAVHAAEVFTTGASGFAHWRLGNVDRPMMLRLVVPGVVGGALGAFALTTLPTDYIKPLVSLYLLGMGALILWCAIRNVPPTPRGQTRLSPGLGLAAGVLDAVGGGGWGAMVTTSLIRRGLPPRYAIGTTNAAEFFVTVVVTGTFVATVGLDFLPAIAGLVIGGVLAAPLGALVAKRVKDRALRAVVGCVVCLLSVRSLLAAL